MFHNWMALHLNGNKSAKKTKKIWIASGFQFVDKRFRNGLSPKPFLILGHFWHSPSPVGIFFIIMEYKTLTKLWANGIHFSFMTKWIGAGVRDSCRNARPRGDPAGRRGGFRTARGKRVPGGEINGQILKT
ncbi:hypothetical protein SRABI96_01313 [Peribacillus sp. Bi96]|uniref:hypothetical protein n=1 Tax=unclassified Peribacillus TaxID=2675266 RepID=UPI001D8A2ABE|nr:hypothetical protein [Peribacillus sp. Bi96]CAH0176110.1 hypothetical protein SRABI96_01313 [Peribacillus sp. Bi96]